MNEPLRVLIACEFSGVVRRAFDALGHDVWSCDTRDAEDRSNRHIKGDVREILDWGWDLLIVAQREAYQHMSRDERLAFMWQTLDDGAALFSDLWNAPVARVAVENPVMHSHAKSRIRNYQEFAQTIQPWQFGDWERKRTCFWLRGVPPLRPLYTSEAECAAALEMTGRPINRVHSLGSSNADRSKERSRFFPTVARAMAEQWGGFALGCAEIAA